MPKVAVLLPCYNESLTIEKVVKDFRAQLPDADIWVYDNNTALSSRARATWCAVCSRKSRPTSM